MTGLYIYQVDLANAAWYWGNLVSVLVTGAQTDGRFALIQTHHTKGHEPPRHVHQHEDEIIYVLEGHVQISVEDVRCDALPGTVVLLPRNSEHSLLLHSATATLLLMLLPAGLEGYFTALSTPATEVYLQDEAGTTPSVEHLVTTAARYGIEITGPP